MVSEVGATRVVTTQAELAEAVRLFLSAPQTDKIGRAAIVDRVVWKRDGRSGERLANEVLAAFGRENF